MSARPTVSGSRSWPVHQVRLGVQPCRTAVAAEFTAKTDVMEQGLTTYKDAANSFGALYGDVDDQDVVAAIVVERPVLAPGAALAGAFGGLAIGGMQIDGVATVEPGPLSGTAKCGTANAGGTGIAVCAGPTKAAPAF
jgi:hypothetical protein